MAFIELLQTYPAVFYTTAVMLGLIFGSFLNVVIYRLPRALEVTWRAECCDFLQIKDEDKSTPASFGLLKPGSRCPACRHKIRAIENIPVISFVMLGGKCANCKDKISSRYPLVEILTAILTLAIAMKFGVTLKMVFACFLTFSLVALAFIDMDFQLLPDHITQPLLWMGLLCNGFGLFTDIHASLMGAVLGYGILWFIYHAYKKMTGKEGMGQGDFKLLAMLGAWFGWQSLALIILISSLLGSIAGIALILFRDHEKTAAIPFGPYLALAGWVYLIWGGMLVDYYHHLGSGP